MKERLAYLERAVPAHHQAPEVAQPAAALDDPVEPVSPQRATIQRRRPNTILFVRTDKFDATLPRPLS